MSKLNFTLQDGELDKDNDKILIKLERENYQNEINKNKEKPPFWKKLKLLVSTLFL